MQRYHKNVAIVRPLVERPPEDSLAADDFLSPVSLETIISSSSSSEEDTDVSIDLLATPPPFDDTKTCLLFLSLPRHQLKIPEEMKSDPENMFYCLEYMSEIHSHLKKTESDAVFPVDSGVLSKQSYMRNWHRSVLVNWLIQVQQSFRLSHNTLYIAINLMDQYFKVRCVHAHVYMYMYMYIVGLFLALHH